MNFDKFDPFSELQAMHRQFFGGSWPTAIPQATAVPATDVYTEDDTHMVIEVHLPHFEQSDVNINVDDGALEIQAEKHEKSQDKSKKYVIRESSSSFYRRVHLPPRADADNIEAHMDHGVLKVTVPFKQLPAPKKISISGSPKKKP